MKNIRPASYVGKPVVKQCKVTVITQKTPQRVVVAHKSVERTVAPQKTVQKRVIANAAPVTTAPAASVPHAKIPKWPFARSSETITISDWPKIYNKIKDKAIKALEHENDEAHLTIKEMLDTIDKLKTDLEAAQATINAVKSAVSV